MNLYKEGILGRTMDGLPPGEASGHVDSNIAHYCTLTLGLEEGSVFCGREEVRGLEESTSGSMLGITEMRISLEDEHSEVRPALPQEARPDQGLRPRSKVSTGPACSGH